MEVSKVPEESRRSFWDTVSSIHLPNLDGVGTITSGLAQEMQYKISEELASQVHQWLRSNGEPDARWLRDFSGTLERTTESGEEDFSDTIPDTLFEQIAQSIVAIPKITTVKVDLQTGGTCGMKNFALRVITKIRECNIKAPEWTGENVKKIYDISFNEKTMDAFQMKAQIVSNDFYESHVIVSQIINYIEANYRDNGIFLHTIFSEGEEGVLWDSEGKLLGLSFEKISALRNRYIDNNTFRLWLESTASDSCTWAELAIKLIRNPHALSDASLLEMQMQLQSLSNL